MSFKREGDDKSQLNILKKRRVADLLSNFIPEDEAALMKNGRYTCLVCSYRPVFDTVDMLTVHRKGKRHLEEQTRKLTHHALLKTVPYNSCHRKTSTKSGKGPTPSGSTSSKTPSEQEHTHWRAGASDIVSPSSAHAAGKVCDGKSFVLNPRPDPNKEPHPPKDVKGSELKVEQEAEPITAQRRKELEHYLKLKSDGWVQDRSGQWIKDENVEFDSDEEEPPSLSSLHTSH
ncbi:hypothetical protein INR49_006264 [Caranx melampygus]|nr:hypothetical protein INR49_006264 [Caranx melampygus]